MPCLKETHKKTNIFIKKAKQRGKKKNIWIETEVCRHPVGQWGCVWSKARMDHVLHSICCRSAIWAPSLLSSLSHSSSSAPFHTQNPPCCTLLMFYSAAYGKAVFVFEEGCKNYVVNLLLLSLQGMKKVLRRTRSLDSPGGLGLLYGFMGAWKSWTFQVHEACI